MVSSLILLRSLRVYLLKQLFFSISVNSGFGNIYLNFKEQLLNIVLFIKSHFKIPFRHTELQKAAKKSNKRGTIYMLQYILIISKFLLSV